MCVYVYSYILIGAFGDELIELNVNNSGLVYHCSQYGVTLIIPEGAVQQPTTVWYGACLLSDRFKFEGDYIPVSPIVWIYIDGQLTKPAELYIPHHIDTMHEENIKEKLVLLTAEDENPFNFQKNIDIQLTINPTMVKINTLHFCSNCVAKGNQCTELPNRYLIVDAYKKDPVGGDLFADFAVIYQQPKCKKVCPIIMLIIEIQFLKVA